MRAESGLWFYQQVINQWDRDAASVVGARVILVRYSCDAVSHTFVEGMVYRAAHHLNLLEPGIVLLVNHVITSFKDVVHLKKIVARWGFRAITASAGSVRGNRIVWHGV